MRPRRRNDAGRSIQRQRRDHPSCAQRRRREHVRFNGRPHAGHRRHIAFRREPRRFLDRRQHVARHDLPDGRDGLRHPRDRASRFRGRPEHQLSDNPGAPLDDKTTRFNSTARGSRDVTIIKIPFTAPGRSQLPDASTSRSTRRNSRSTSAASTTTPSLRRSTRATVQIVNNQVITAPNNFAFDTAGNVISINTMASA